MAPPRNQNRAPLPSSPSNSKYATDDITVEKKRKIANPRMPTAATGGRPIRQAFAVVNAAPDLAPASGPPSTAGSDSTVFEFTKEDVEALLAEKLKTKNKFNTKEKCDLMSEYIRRLKLCIKWFQQLEENNVTQQASLKSLLESAEKKCNEMEVLMWHSCWYCWRIAWSRRWLHPWTAVSRTRNSSSGSKCNINLFNDILILYVSCAILPFEAFPRPIRYLFRFYSNNGCSSWSARHKKSNCSAWKSLYNHIHTGHDNTYQCNQLRWCGDSKYDREAGEE